eukprot:1161984-Pelagomonas_calceolata.AAC.4
MHCGGWNGGCGIAQAGPPSQPHLSKKGIAVKRREQMVKMEAEKGSPFGPSEKNFGAGVCQRRGTLGCAGAHNVQWHMN